MTPERWKRTEQLFHAAVALPPDERAAFLAKACPEDEALQRDVQSLLNEPDSADGFLAGPAVGMAAELLPDLAGLPLTGRSLAGYHLQTLLGAGGMGEVYRARDSTLGRAVAIKILPSAFTRDPDRLARFEREARMLAALNHPNICAIYGFDRADEVRFLILELIDGETLAEKLAHLSHAHARPSGLPLLDALTVARQLADALDAAHEKGIIHRDLKPANIKITPDGVAKILDFGLAKGVVREGMAADPMHGPAVTRDGSRDGLMLGTAAYMSPEQARGKPVDKRTDIWAFGCVVYEMLSGRVAFAGETIADTIAKIIDGEPDWSALPAATPTSIRRLLLRCVTKDPRHRLRDIGDARLEIDGLDEALPGMREPGLVSLAEPSRRWRWLPWVALIALAAAAGTWEASRPAASGDNPLANARFTPFTNWEGTEEGAAISPDGKFVAFLADRAGEWDIWLSQVGSGHFSNLTRDFPPLPSSGVIVRKLGFSGDGTEIWLNTSDERPLLIMPLTGGTPRPFLIKGANTPAWAPDGNRLVYFYKPDGDATYLADRSGADARQILGPGPLKNNNPVWSPNGDWIYFVRGAEPQDENDVDVWRLRSSGGSPERLTEQHAGVNFLAAIDPLTLLYTARAEDWSGPWLWALDIERRVTRRVTSGIDQYTSVDASRDGRRIVATVANPSSGLWRVPIGAALADERDAQPYTLPVPTGRAMAPRFGGTSLFYLSARGTSDGLWKVQDGVAWEVWRDLEGAVSEPVAVSPDGRRVAVAVRREGKRHLWIMSPDGTDVRTLAASIELEGAAGQGTTAWSPDGRSIVAGGRDAKGPALFLIPVDGGAPTRLVEGKWVNPLWSPDGSLIVYAGRSYVGQVALLGIRPDATPVELPPVMVRPGGYRFLPDGSGLVYLPRIPSLDFWLLDLRTRSTRQITRLGNQGALRTFDITPDGKSIVFDRSRQNANIVLIELPN